MSHFFYLHKDLTGEPDAWKLGIALTPYSAVRARQKFCWNKFKLDRRSFQFQPNYLHVDQALLVEHEYLRKALL